MGVSFQASVWGGEDESNTKLLEPKATLFRGAGSVSSLATRWFAGLPRAAAAPLWNDG